MSEKHEKRHFIRVPESSDIVYQVDQAKTKKKTSAKDLSETGICFISEEKLPVGAVIYITLALEKLGFSFTAHGTVRWINEVVKNRRYEVGVQFENLPDLTMKKLINYIQAIKRLDSYV